MASINDIMIKNSVGNILFYNTSLPDNKLKIHGN